jgi:hypothetical protein
MQLHLYALVEEPARLPEVAGVAGASLSSVAVDGIAAVVSAASETEDIEAAVLAHAAVVEGAARLNDPVLPVRFSGPVPGANELMTTIARRRPEIEAGFERVRGCVELGLRVVLTSADVAGQTPSSGREYMVARLNEIRAAEELADFVDVPLAALARERTRQVLATPKLILSAAYLIPRDALDSFRRRVDELGAKRRDAQLVCTGPWPPYSFAIIGPETFDR